MNKSISLMNNKELFLYALNASSFLSYIYEWGSIKKYEKNKSKYIKNKLNSLTSDLHKYMSNLNHLLTKIKFDNPNEYTDKICNFDAKDEGLFTDLDVILTEDCYENIDLTDKDHKFINKPYDLALLEI